MDLSIGDGSAPVRSSNRLASSRVLEYYPAARELWRTDVPSRQVAMTTLSGMTMAGSFSRPVSRCERPEQAACVAWATDRFSPLT